MADDEKVPASAPKPLTVQLPRILDVPAVYMNSCSVNLAVSDMFITMMQNGKPFQIVNMSYTTAKSLSENLVKALSDYEDATGLKVITMKATKEALEKKIQSK